MNGRAAYVSSLQPDRLDLKRLFWAFALSLALHLAFWGGYEAGKKFGIWDNLHMPAWLAALKQSLVKPANKEPAPLAPENEAPLVFVEVNPQQATSEPPKDANYYSDKNSRAANPNADAYTGIPKIDGTQEHVAKTEDTERNQFDKLQPYRPPQPAPEEMKPKPAPEMGDLVLAKADPNPRRDNPQTEKSRPRTVQEALTRQQLNKIPGAKMKQEGGVRRKLEFASLDARATPFGAYDAAFIEAVSQRWYDLLDGRNYAGQGHGRVILKFHLRYDGTITDLGIADTSVDTILSYLCQQAVRDPAPYERWPSDMRRLMGKDFREIQFTFYYD